MLITQALKNHIESFLEEDDLVRNMTYQTSLPSMDVPCTLKFKTPMKISGLPFFFTVFGLLGDEADHSHLIREFEGKVINGGEIEFLLPFSVAINGERVALNLLQRASAITTFTSKFVEKAKKYNIEILDTRKTTPGLRWLEKYATQLGGAKNHRFGQVDMWMIKDNHKTFFGGVKPAIEFFRSQGSYYNPILLEVHEEKEIEEGMVLGVNHFMLDNFTPERIKEVITMKKEGVTFEVSGGITLDSMEDYCIPGVDALSVGSITYGAPHVDISLKFGDRS